MGKWAYRLNVALIILCALISVAGVVLHNDLLALLPAGLIVGMGVELVLTAWED